jgi:anti-sigma regulatory factor (Ser/Thr protein kinase)
MRWALDQYRSQNFRGLVHRARDAPSPASVPSPLIDVLRAAMSSIEQYRLIKVGRVATLAVVHSAADDLSMRLAELLDNAAKYAPQTSTITVNARPTSQGGVLLSIEDAGAGIPAERRRALNAQFHAARKMDSAPSEQTGFAVVCRLAAKHGMRVSVGKPGEKGTIAVVFLPPALVCEPPERPWLADMPLIRTPPPAPAPADVKASLPTVTKRSWTGRTTRNGLPQREPHSLREFASFAPTVPRPREDPDGFCAGGRAARNGQPQPETPEGPSE